MPPIRFGGIASGLPPNLVEQIMANERLPIQNLEAKKTGINTKLELVGDFESRLRKVGDSMNNIIGTKGFNDYAINNVQPNPEKMELGSPGSGFPCFI